MNPAVYGTIAQRAQCLLGVVTFVLIAYGVGQLRAGRSLQRPPVPWRAVVWGLALQFIFALVVLYTPRFLQTVNDVINALLGYTRDGAELVFGDLAKQTGAPVTDEKGTVIGYARQVGYFAFFVLPTIIFFSCLTAIAYHVGVMQYVVQGLAWVMSKTMKTSGAETLSAAANIFVGQTEAPLLVKPFVAAATRSELMCIMVAGFANIATGVLGLYTAWLEPFVKNAGGHLAAACFVSAPAALLVSKLMVPETETPVTSGGVEFKVERTDANLVDAAARGTSEGLTLALNVGAMLIAFTALMALVNGFLGWASVASGVAPVDPATGKAVPFTLQHLLGYPLAPAAWLCGVRWSEAREVGSLLGIKTVLNELFAYLQMSQNFKQNPAYLSPRSALIATYALCGFANFASVGIQVGGISTLAPSRRADLSRLGLLAMLGGGLASLMTAAVMGALL
jgi:CNT family concentrative nucleoside transporter